MGGAEAVLFKSSAASYTYEFTTKTDGLYEFCIKSTVDNDQTISVQLKVDAHLQPNSDVVSFSSPKAYMPSGQFKFMIYYLIS